MDILISFFDIGKRLFNPLPPRPIIRIYWNKIQEKKLMYQASKNCKFHIQIICVWKKYCHLHNYKTEDQFRMIYKYLPSRKSAERSKLWGKKLVSKRKWRRKKTRGYGHIRTVCSSETFSNFWLLLTSSY